MASSIPGADSTPQLPDYVPVPEAALGPALNEQGYSSAASSAPGSGSPTAPTGRRWIRLDLGNRLTGPPMTERSNDMAPVFGAATEVAV